MKKLILAGSVLLLSGCAATTGAPVSQNVTAEKSAVSICATAGAALQALVVAGAAAELQKIKPEAEILHPICKDATPSEAVTGTEAKAYEAIIDAAAPYMGD